MFKEHIPKNPKTNLPMHTYHVDVPSVLTYKERNAEEGEVDKQELKIEFIMESEDWEFTRKTGKMLKKAQEKRAAMEDYFEHRFASQQRIQSLFKEGLNVDARIAGVQSSALGAMAIAAYEQSSIVMPII